MSCFGIAFVAGFAYASWAMVCRSGRCPSAQSLKDYEPRQTSKIYAADGRFVAELGIEKRTLIKLADVPSLVQSAFVVTEDKRFYEHSGIDWKRVPGAMLNDIRHLSWNEGFSTITMQLARNIFPERISRDKSVVRKLKEAKVAREIERTYTKQKILELYLNQIYLGNGAYGVSSAAQRYFGKSVSDLNIAEAAMLAALPKGPERYNPRTSPERAVQRRNTVIGLMRDAGLISGAQANEAQAYPLRLATRVDAGETAPYFVEWIREQLDDKFGKQLYEQGLNVYTTLDLDMQSAAERSLEKQIRAIEAGRYGPFPHKSYEHYIGQGADDEQGVAASSPYLQGAFIAMDPRTGSVRALVGGRDFYDNQFDRARQALRQPGSTFKPIVYADAVQNGRPLSYILDDSPLTVQLSNNSEWTPRNFEGDFAGKVTMRRALYQSRNVPTIRLGMELGVQSVTDEARKFGLTTPIPPYPSIFIGAAEVYPLELVSAYTAFATLGTRAEPMAITRVEDQDGNVLWTPEPTTATVLSPDEAWLMVSVMKDVVQRGTAAASVGAVFHAPAGGKTGTTDDGTNVWFVGYTSDLVAGVWMGFDQPQKIKDNAQGGVLAAPAWSSFMNEVYSRKPQPRDWPMPMGLVTRQIDVTTNMLATPYCPLSVVMNEFYIPGTDPVQQCDVHTGPVNPDTIGTPLTIPPAGQDTLHPNAAIVTVPGAATPLRPSRPPIDTSHRPATDTLRRPRADTSRASRDSAIFVVPRRPPPPKPDTTRVTDF